MRFVPSRWWPFRAAAARRLLNVRPEMLEGRPVVLATAELPEGEVLVVEWGDEPAVVVEGAWTGKAWLLEGPPDTAAQMTFRVRSRAAGALRRAAGPQGGHLLASGIWDARNL